MQLVAADAGQRARRSANFSREVRERGDVVAVEGDSIGELAAGNLHAVAGISGKTDHCAFDDFALVLRQRNIGGGGHASLQLPYDSSLCASLPIDPRGGKLARFPHTQNWMRRLYWAEQRAGWKLRR